MPFRMLIPFVLLGLIAAALAGCGSAPSAEMLKDLEPGTYAWFKTNYGEILARLEPERAPVTTSNFVGLAAGTKPFQDPVLKREVQRPFYDGLIFHRIVKDFVLQGGDPLGTGVGGPGYEVADEFHPELRHDKPGILSMANSGPNTNGSQFFITLAPAPHLDDRHPVFGEVVRGMDVVERIGQVPVRRERPLRDVVMERVRIITIPAPAAS